MATPTYTTDLIRIVDFDADTPTVAETSTWASGRSPTIDTDFPIQGTNHGSETMNTTGKASMVATGTTFTWSTGIYIFGWVIWLAPGAIATQANGGLAIFIGSSASVYKVYYVGGSDFGSYPYGGWQNFAVDPNFTADETSGTPSAYNVVGVGANVLSAVAKGNPLGMDVFRYGRGELRVAGGQTGSYATFEGMATQNDTNTNRWGLFQKIEGGYKFKGLMYLGYGALTEFVDANKSIVIDKTEKVPSTFNAIEIHTATSSVSWTNISITALGTTSKGTFTVVDNATVLLDSCTFTDMNTFTFQSNTTILSNTFRRCGLVTQGSSTITSSLFTNATGTVALAVNALASVTKCTFVSSGTGHAVNLGTVSTTTSMTWDNADTGYATQVGTAANRTILVNVASGQTLTINVTDTATTPTYYNTGTGSVSVVAGQKSFAFTVSPAITGYEWRLYSVTAVGSLAGSSALAGEETASVSNQSYSYSYSTDTPIAVQIIDDNYEESITYYTLVNSNQSVTIKLSLEENT